MHLFTYYYKNKAGKVQYSTLLALHSFQALHNARFEAQAKGCEDIRSVIIAH